MVVIGVTGNIGSGKSTVCRILARLGARVIDADRLAHEAYKPQSQTWHELVDIFGEDIVRPDGKIDRQRLGQIVFSDPDALAQLNRAVHPEAYRLAQERIADYRSEGAKAVALEATLLIEAGWQDLVDEVWLVVAPEAAVLQRLGSQEGTSQHQILARLRSQMPAEEKVQHANKIIYNDGSPAQLRSRVTELWRNLNID